MLLCPWFATTCRAICFTVEAGETITQVAQRMVERNIGAALVVDGGQLVGIMTERDLMRAVARGLHGDAVLPST